MTLRWVGGTVVTGIPNGAPSISPDPKSGCNRPAAPSEATQAADEACTGRVRASACHTLSAGNTEQPAGALVVVVVRGAVVRGGVVRVGVGVRRGRTVLAAAAAAAPMAAAPVTATPVPALADPVGAAAWPPAEQAVNATATAKTPMQIGNLAIYPTLGRPGLQRHRPKGSHRRRGSGTVPGMTDPPDGYRSCRPTA